ncbi:MAG TPA: hypothetical protein VHJ77_13255 [Vicinamibacterales bacterium]|jgi:hypothetical protein|nr:hypothetical protein [Vicinamibacterales bacterium]
MDAQRNKSRLRGCIVVVACTAAAATAVAVPGAQTGPRRFSEAQIFVELNHTDSDLGLHASIDGESWTRLEIEGPGELPLLNLFSRGRLSAQGLTQLAFESAEPPFEELSPAQFFRRFPEGRYEIEARAQDGAEIESVAFLSHVLAAPPENVLVSGMPAAENCDAALPQVHPPVVIDWDPVTTSHPDVGKRGPVTIANYQLFVERPGVLFSLDLPRGVTRVEVPELVTSRGEEFKFEIIARTTRGNNTAVESCFRLF